MILKTIGVCWRWRWARSTLEKLLVCPAPTFVSTNPGSHSRANGTGMPLLRVVGAGLQRVFFREVSRCQPLERLERAACERTFDRCWHRLRRCLDGGHARWRDFFGVAS